MSDQRLRRLEREAAASPSPEAEAALLRERLRAGTLSPERLELAAYAGSIGARCCLDACSCGCGWPRGTPTAAGPFLSDLHRDADHTDSRSLAVWVAGLSRWGPAVLHLASVSAAKVDLVEDGRRRGETCMCGGSILGCDGHNFTHMCDYHGVECSCPVEPSPRLTEAITAADKWLGMGLHVSDHAGYETQRAYDLAWSRSYRMAPWLPAPWASDGARQSEIAGSAALAGEAPVRSAIQSALISWALGSQG